MVRARDYVLYLVSSVLVSEGELSCADALMGCFGAWVHLSAWAAAITFDGLLLAYDFSDDGSLLYKTQEAATILIALSGGVILMLQLVHALGTACGTLSFNDGLIPAALTSIIAASARASAVFSVLLLIGGLVVESTQQKALYNNERISDILVAQVATKSLLVSLVVNNGRFRASPQERGFVVPQ